MLRLTVPRRVSDRAALDWAAGQRGWVEARLRDQPDNLPLLPGGQIPFEGVDVELAHDEAASRRVRLEAGRLCAGGPREGYERRLLAWLRKEARDRLSAEAAEIARAAGVTIRSISVGDPVSRWGSCSASGAIRFSWRLILAPPEARRFVVAHEVAHRLHMNHGPDFKKAETMLFGGDPAPARALLRRIAPRLRAVGRG